MLSYLLDTYNEYYELDEMRCRIFEQILIMVGYISANCIYVSIKDCIANSKEWNLVFIQTIFIFIYFYAIKFIQFS